VPNPLDQFEDAAIDWLRHRPAGRGRVAPAGVPPAAHAPDFANLPKLIDADFRTRDAVPFGNYPIHTLLTTAQLDDLAKLNPGVRNSPAFVRAYAAKLQPGADDDWKRDAKLTAAYLDRLKAFAPTASTPCTTRSRRTSCSTPPRVRPRPGGVRPRPVPRVRQAPAAPAVHGADVSERPESRSWPADLNADYTQWTLPSARRQR